MSTGSPQLMRRMNAARILREIRQGGPMSRADLARITGLSKPTVTNVVDYLCEGGHLRPMAGEAPLQPTGRRPQLYEFTADLHRVLGLDIGADKLVAVVTNLDGEVLGVRRRDMLKVKHEGRERILDTIRETARALLTRAGVGENGLLAVSAGTPGVVSPEGVVTIAPQLAGWEGLNLAEALGEMFGCRAYVEREVILSLLAEQWLGAAKGLDDVLFVHLGVGVAAAFLLNGQIYRGADGGAGEIGAMPLASGVAPRLIGNFGPFEAATGGAALGALGAAAAGERDGARLRELAGGDPAAVTAAHVFAAAAEGDATAASVVDTALAHLSTGIAGLVCALNPRAVILSGGLARAGDQLLRPLREQVSRQVPFAPQFVISTLGEEAVALGAVRRVTETLEQDLILAEA